jgi:hypothetical protein
MVQLLLHRAQPVFLLGDFVLVGLALRLKLLLNALRGSRFLKNELDIHHGDDRCGKLRQSTLRLPRHKAKGSHDACQPQG